MAIKKTSGGRVYATLERIAIRRMAKEGGLRRCGCRAPLRGTRNAPAYRMSKKKKARKAAKKRARALRSLAKAVGLTAVAFSAGALQNTLKKRAIDLVQSVLGRIEGLREAYSERLSPKEEAGSRRDKRPNGVMAS